MIKLHNVSKRFGSFQAVNDVSLHIEGGEIFGIIGTSGAGKSTLLRLMNFLERPDQGNVIFNGRDLNDLTSKQLRQVRQSLSMIFQSHHLVKNKTVFHNVAVPLEIAKVDKSEQKERILESLRFVGLEDLQAQYPNQLSGGQMQRVAIARAIVNQPKVLLCDEPTSSLDPHTTVELLKVLKKVNKELNMTIVIVSHEMDVIKSLCERVIVIEDGKVFDAFSIQPKGVDQINKGAIGLVEQLKNGGEPHFS